ncbi:MAG: SMP-30/gluconolactonase/LRE family protein [Sandaracinaceae bacterium]|nr:SMP-30/gluconolactonase/LRE family protein [Sandaracinaceae bacterium]
MLETRLPLALSLLSLLVLAACDDGTGGTDAAVADTGVGIDAGTSDDAGAGVDAGADAGEGLDAGDVDAGGGLDAGGDVDAGGPSCGSARPDVSGIGGTEGLVIARDGTLYYSQTGAVGRLQPGGTPENAWVSVGGGTVWGLALDAANETLYVGVPGTGVRAIDLTAATPAATTVATGGSPNGLTVGPDDALYYSDFSAGRVYRLAPGGTPTEVTTTTIASANGVAFLPDGTLLVASYATGVLHRLTLTAGAETARATFATGLGSADGLALDADGNVYVGSQSSGGRLIRLSPDGSSPTTLLMNVRSIANVEFGAGPLTCTDLYVTSAGMMQRYEAGDVPGAPVPWH